MSRPRSRPSRIYHRAVGFNPFRQQRKTVVDVIIVIAFALITLGFVLWALLSG